MDGRTIFRGILTIAAGLVAAMALALLGGSAVALGDEPVVQIVYVDADASAGGDGQSWSTAYRYLQDALDEANAHGDDDYEIWVAEGVYNPDEDADGDHLNDVVTETFRIAYNNVQLYGGFAGGETARDERDGAANVTVLSGDIDGDDTTDARGVVVDADDVRGRNAYRVLWLDGQTSEPITGVTVIDGLTITAGQADGSEEDDGGGLYCAGNGSESVGNVPECSPTLANITFSGNSAEFRGGAMYNDGGDGGASSPTLINVTFSGNSAGASGGAMFNNGHYGASSPTLTNVTFSGNSAGRDGGAVHDRGIEGVSSPTLTNVTFNGNWAGEDGGAMYNNGAMGGASSPTLTNITFSGNLAEEDGGAMSNYGGLAGGVSSPTLTNVILWGNIAGGDGDQMYNEDAAPAIGYSLVEGGWDGSGIHNVDSSVTDSGGNIDADPLFVDGVGGNLRLQGSSPGIDAGDNDALPPAVTTDLDGHLRFVDVPTVSDTGKGTPPIVDMGAYEVPAGPYLILSKEVTPETSAALQGTITYTFVLNNLGPLSDTHVLLTDTLPARATFAGWIEEPPGTAVEDRVITWSGTVEAGAAITFRHTADYACDGYGKVLTNTAEFSGTAQPGWAQASFAAEPAVLYVDADASGAASGLSWTDAYTNVQDALDRTNAHGNHAYEIWVAEGVYTPDQDGDGDHLREAATETFRIGYNNVQLYGGFAGGETAREERDWAANVTVLSGDVDGDDVTDARGVVTTTSDIAGLNAYHVLYLDGRTNEPITDSTVIDGFTITAGRADEWLGPETDGGGLYCKGNGDVFALVSAECSPAISNVTFSGNLADYGGGAMYNDGSYGGASSPTLTNVTFSGNLAQFRGGAIYNNAINGASSPTLTNVALSGNLASSDGGAMYNDGTYGGASSPTLTNLTFSGNSAGYGGALYDDGDGGASSPILTNVTFSGNSAGYGGAVYNYGRWDGAASPTLTNVTFGGNSAVVGAAMVNDGLGGASSPTLTNVILWGNTAEILGDQMYNSESTPAIGYSLVEGGWDGAGITNDDSSVTDMGGNIDGDPLFINVEGGNLRLQGSSPAIDAGDNTAVPPGVAMDVIGSPRFVDVPTIGDTGRGTPPIVDMGAYEVQMIPYLILSKDVTPEISADLQGTITYTVILHNAGPLSDAHVLLTDTLPAQATFGGWIEEPSGAVVEDGAITWSDAVAAGVAVTFRYTADYACGGYGEVLTNTAEFSGTLQSGRAEASVAAEPAVLYVDRDASGAATGLSWTDAFTDVQDALDRTTRQTDAIYEIWVAEGVYRPDRDTGGPGDLVTGALRIAHDNVRLYGGFAGGETAREQRDWQANVTVLSGDIDGDDATDAHGVVLTTADIAGSNAYHVLWLDGETEGPITGGTIIDGFTITAGQAAGDPPDNIGGGTWCAGSEALCSPTLRNLTFSGNWADWGGAMFNEGSYGGASSPMLTHVTFRGNSARYSGGAMYNDGYGGGVSRPTLTNVIFSGNAANYGGAMLNDGSYGGSHPTLTNVTFSGNSAQSDGGALYNGGYSGASSPTLTNVAFSGNVAARDGGAMYNNGRRPIPPFPPWIKAGTSVWQSGQMDSDGRSGAGGPAYSHGTFSGNWAGAGEAALSSRTEAGGSNPTLTNVTFSGNAAKRGGAMFSDGSEIGASSPRLTNVVLWANTTSGEGDQMYNVQATPAIGYTLVEGGWDGSGIFNDESSVTDNGGNIDADPLFVDGAGGNLRLQISSSAIDAGDNSAVPPGVTTDLDGHLRFVDIPTVGDTGNGTPPIVDMGAYEVKNLHRYVYVLMFATSQR